MNEQSRINKQAWEYRAYEFWCRKYGTPDRFAKTLTADPLRHLKKHRDFFSQMKPSSIANLCGSNGRKAVPLSLLGHQVTVFDISEENRRFAMELAACANTPLEYVVTDLYGIDLEHYGDRYDIVYLEGGVLHYFDDLHRLAIIFHRLLKPGGQLVLSDFHPLRNCLNGNGKYFSKSVTSGELAYQAYFSKEEHDDFPAVSIRHHTLEDIFNAVIDAGLTVKRFREHPGWSGENLPWEFTLYAVNDSV